MRMRAAALLTCASLSACGAIFGLDDHAPSNGAGDGGTTGADGAPLGDGASGGDGTTADCAGVDLQNDANNCGACGRTCAGSPCTKGACPPFSVAVGSSPSAIAASDAVVLWSDISGGDAGTTAAYRVWRVDVSNGATPVANGTLTVGAVYTGSAFFFGDVDGNGELHECTATADDCSKTIPVSGASVGAGYLAVDLTQKYLAWATYSQPSTVYGCTLPCTAPMLLTGNAPAPQALAVDDADVYLAGWNAGSIAAVSRGVVNGTARTVLAGRRSPQGIAVDGTNVYFTERGEAGLSNGGLYRLPKVGGVPTAIVAQEEAPGPLALANGLLYWGVADVGDKTAGVLRCPVAGCKEPLVLAKGYKSVRQIAVAGAYAYFTTESGVIRVAR